MVVLRPELAPHELSTPERRAALVAELGPDELVSIRFSHEFSLIEHEQFAEQVLRDRLGAELVSVGRNFRYGHRAQGSIETLAASGARLGFEVEPAPLLEMDGAPVSSSRIRDLVSAGEVEHAGRLLGRPPWIEGTIVRGDGRGRDLGFATANLDPAPRAALPGTGIYAGRAHLDAGSHAAAISVGYNPTFSDDRDRVRIEAHLLDFGRDIYGQPLRLDLLRRLRGEQRFGSSTSWSLRCTGTSTPSAPIPSSGTPPERHRLCTPPRRAALAPGTRVAHVSGGPAARDRTDLRESGRSPLGCPGPGPQHWCQAPALRAPRACLGTAGGPCAICLSGHAGAWQRSTRRDGEASF